MKVYIISGHKNIINPANSFSRAAFSNSYSGKKHFKRLPNKNKHKLSFTLTQLLSEADWRRYQEWLYYDEEGYIRHNYNRLIQLYLYLSSLQWERGYHDDAFASLDLALKHAKELDKVHSGHAFTAPLVSFVKFISDSAPATESDARTAELLPDDWPFWHTPDYSQAEKEIKADPRWAEWVARTKEPY